MRGFFKDIPWKKIVAFFLIWRLGLFVVAAVAPGVITAFGYRFPYSQELLVGSGLPYWLWPFGNFDGVHYIGIAANGYAAQYTQAFFPLFPLLVRFLSINGSYLLTGILMSNLLFLVSLFLLYKLFRIDFDERVSLAAVVLLIVFPTAYYFGSLYTESLFLLLSASCVFLARRGKFFLSGVFIALASATRVIGLCLIPLLLIEIYLEAKGKRFPLKRGLYYLASLIVAPLGTLAYMVYLKVSFNNPFYFLTAQPAFGAQRSSQPFVLLPQVLYRYIKIFATTPIRSLGFFNASTEFLFALVSLVLLVVIFKRIRFSYWVFILLSLLLPTLTGTFSSMPRYALTSYLMFPPFAAYLGRYFKAVVVLYIVLQIIFAAIFLRGYWIA